MAPVTTRFALIRARNACRAVTGGNRAKPGREPSQLAQTPVDHATPSPLAVSDDTHATLSLPSLSQSARRARASRADRPNTRQADSALDPLRAPDRGDSTERELRNSHDMDPQTIERAIRRCIDISTRLGALEDEVPHEAGRVIVQCVDEIDEMQRWLEGRE